MELHNVTIGRARWATQVHVLDLNKTSVAAQTEPESLIGAGIGHSLCLPHNRILKRIVDVVLAILCFVGSSPLLIASFILVWLSSPGPVFYGHRRISRNGAYFTLYKFRSMVANADELLDVYLSADPELRDEWNRTHKLRNDPRVLGVGRVLRRLSLDELPQLWNVIKGEMSLIGPRPIVNAEVVRYGTSFSIYKMVRPGITGMSQVSGRSDISYAERVRCDEYYVKNWSPWLDVRILIRTIKTVLLSKGAC
jgi:Undecaprenyl-phosphate galactose phosphotransferase WbaP